MRYWAAGFLLTVLLFGGALLGAGKDTGTPGLSRMLTRDKPGQSRDKAPPTGRFCCGCGTGSRWWR